MKGCHEEEYEILHYMWNVPSHPT